MRFLSRDPLKYAELSQGPNLYAYAKNSPVNLMDPMGLHTNADCYDQYEEDPTGLLNEGFRYRDLDAGVFITKDPAGFIDGPNVYTYVSQNPWTKFDPEGLSPKMTAAQAEAEEKEGEMLFNFIKSIFGKGKAPEPSGPAPAPAPAPAPTVEAPSAPKADQSPGGPSSKTTQQATQDAPANTAPAKPDAATGPYANLPDGPTVGPGKDFTKAQKQKILDQNKAQNGGQLTSDQSGQPLVPAQKSQAGVTPPDNEVQVDHIEPKANNGSNSNSNAQAAGGGNIRTSYVYDGNSRLVELVDDRDAATVYAYDLLDRQITKTLADGSVSTNVYDYGNGLIGFTDENGSAFVFTVDALGRRTAVAITLATGVVGTTAQSFQYDGLSRNTQAIDTVGSTNAEVE